MFAWRLSKTREADFCVEALEQALAHYGRPEIFNTYHHDWQRLALAA